MPRRASSTITTFLNPDSLSGEKAVTSCLTGAYTVLNNGTLSSHFRRAAGRAADHVRRHGATPTSQHRRQHAEPGHFAPSTHVDNGLAMPSTNRNVHTSVTTVMKSGTVTTRPVRKLRRNHPSRASPGLRTAQQPRHVKPASETGSMANPASECDRRDSA